MSGHFSRGDVNKL